MSHLKFPQLFQLTILYEMNPQKIILIYSLLLLVFLVLGSVTTCNSSSYEEVDGSSSRPRPSHLYFGAINRRANGVGTRRRSVSRLSQAITTTSSSSSATKTVINVVNYGAKSDGTDASGAFKKAWKAACSSKRSVVLVVPKGKTYQLKPVTFSGPCKSDIVVKIWGTIKASPNRDDYKADRRHWLVFDSLKNIRVKGGGTINGNGKIWWQNSCKINKSLPCVSAPTAVVFNECKNVIVSNLRIINAQQMHISFQKCVNVRALKLMVTSPGNSPNTDGIHVTGTQNIRIRNSVIKTGDDCISIVSGSKNVEATDIVCGPGHGISIGSLGAGNSEAEVSNVFVNRATLTGTTNGVRIKTWQGGSGYAKNIMFQNIVMRNVSNPIIIDQNYCDQTKPCSEKHSAVQVSNVIYKNIKGTSASEVATEFNCSRTFPCRGIILQNVNLVPEEGGTPEAKCDNVNVNLVNKGKVYPKCQN